MDLSFIFINDLIPERNTMKKKLIIIFSILISILNLKASPQAPDYLIIGKDTLPLYNLILED